MAGSFLYGIIDFGNIFKAFIGANYLSMPFTMMQGGLALAIGFMLLNIVVTEHCCHLIIRGKRVMMRQILKIYDDTSSQFGSTEEHRETLERRMVQNTQLGNLAEFAFGKPGRYAIEAALVFTQCGFCVVYFIFIGTVATQLWPLKAVNATGSTTQPPLTSTPVYGNSAATPEPEMVTTAPNIIYLIMAPFPIFWASCLVRTVRGLGVISIVANLSIFCGWGVIFYDLIHGFKVSNDFEYVSWDTVPVLIGMVIPTFEGIGMMMPIENGMKGNRRYFRPLLAVAMYFAGIVVSSFGVLGYLRYGSNTKQILIENIPQHTMLSKVVDITLIVGVLFTYPLQNFPTIELVEKWFFSKGVGCCAPIHLSVMDDNDVNGDSVRLVRNESFITSLRQGSSDVLHGNDTGADLEIDAPWWKRYILRSFIVFTQLGMAILLRNLYAYVISFIGALGSAFLAFIFPCAVQLKLEWNDLSVGIKVKSICIVTFGVIASIVAVIGTIVTVIQKVTG